MTTESQSPTLPKKGWRRVGHFLLVVFTTIVLGLGAALLYGQVAFAGLILPGVKINGVDIGGLTIEQAALVLESSGVAKVELVVDGETIEADPLVAGISFDAQEAARVAFNLGHRGSWWQRFNEATTTAITPPNLTQEPHLDEEQMNWFINDTAGKLITEPKSAALKVTGSAITIEEGQDGRAVDLERLKKDLATAAARGGQTVRATVITKKVAPVITAEELAPFKPLLEQYAAIPITLIVESAPIAVPRSQILTWLTVVENGGLRVAVNSEAVTASVTALTKNYNKKVVAERVDAAGNVVSAGQDGQQVDTAAVAGELIRQMTAVVAEPPAANPTAIAAAVPVTAQPKTVVTVQSADADVTPLINTEAKFAQVDRGRQKIYLFEGGQLINVFSISSGKAGMETPAGVHKIYNKARRPFSKSYGLYMPYWMAITADGQYGLHELPEWPSGYKEGENHLGVPVSHGCIRLGVGPAAYLYEWAPLGMAVVVI